jgi:hypothetical protein
MRLQHVQCLEQHLALGAIGGMKRGVQRQFGPRQEQCKRVVIGAQFMAAARAHAQAAAVSGNQSQAVPAHRIDMGLGQRNQMSARQFEQFGRQPSACLAEGLRADAAVTPAVPAQCTEQRVELGLHTGTHARHHQRGHARQGQGAIAGKGAGRKTHAISERRIEQEI